MNEHLAMWNVYASYIMNTPYLLAIVICSFALSSIFYALFRKTNSIKQKVVFLYLHILFIFLPFISSVTLWRCMMPIVSCSPKMVIYLTSIGAGGTFLISFVTLPYIYNWASHAREIKEGRMKRFVRSQSDEMGIPEPKVYVIDEIRPCAYSITNIRPSIFLTVGLCEILDKKEMEAVLLHELHHVRQKASFWRFSMNILKIFSPLSSFITTDEAMDGEEREADLFATTKQGTKRFLRSAKDKVNKMSRRI